MSLNPTEGHIIAGTKIDTHRFVGRVKAAQLFQIAPDPRDSENKKKLDASKHIQDLMDVREEVQRLFEGTKKKNVVAYAEYIVELNEGSDGITPPITLYTDKELLVDERDDGGCQIQIPWGEQLVAIDGETQLAARYEAANLKTETKNEFVAVYVCHGRDRLWARQSFHDLNTLGVKPNAALSIGMDARDPLTGLSRDVERQIAFFSGRVNKVRRQLRSSDVDVVTITTLRGACVTLAKGINGIQFGSRPVPIDPVELVNVKAAAITWFETVADIIGPAMQDREHKLAGTPAVFAAIGAMGFPLASIADTNQRKTRALEIAGTLANVNWERGKRWEGIAGKFTPKGAFSVGGAKETAYAVYSALTDPSDAGYSQARVQMKAAA